MTPDTPPRPERTPTDVLVERARARIEADYPFTDDLLTALAEALKDTAAERDRAVSDLALERAVADRLDKIATQAVAERDRAHATLREIRDAKDGYAAVSYLQVLARERLENP